jgi:hypothetical protein
MLLSRVSGDKEALSEDPDRKTHISKLKNRQSRPGNDAHQQSLVAKRECFGNNRECLAVLSAARMTGIGAALIMHAVLQMTALVEGFPIIPDSKARGIPYPQSNGMLLLAQSCPAKVTDR